MAPEKEAGKNVHVKRVNDANLVADHGQEREDRGGGMGTNLLQGELLTAGSSESRNEDIAERGLGDGETAEIVVNEYTFRAVFCEEISLEEGGDFLARRAGTDMLHGQRGRRLGRRKVGIG